MFVEEEWTILPLTAYRHGEAGVTTDDALQSHQELRAKFELMKTKYKGLSQFERGRYLVEHAGFARE